MPLIASLTKRLTIAWRFVIFFARSVLVDGNFLLQFSADLSLQAWVHLRPAFRVPRLFFLETSFDGRLSVPHLIFLRLLLRCVLRE